MARYCGRLALLALACGCAALLLTGAATPSSSQSGAAAKLRGDLAALVDGETSLDPLIAGLVPGFVAGEIPFFAILSQPNDAAHAAQLTALGARILRTYKTVDAFALAGQPGAVLSVAALPWVRWLEPVELVFALDHEQEGDQTKGTPIDVGATALWNDGVTGEGVRIAVLDTGLDPNHPDLDDLDFRHWSDPANPPNQPKVFESRSFLGGVCAPGNTVDGNGHGTHVAGIAAGTGEGAPGLMDNGKYAGVAPGAELVIGKVFTEAGAGLNADLAGAMEAMAMPEDVANCQFGADVVNMSLGSDSRPTRLNTDSSLDETGQVFLSHLLNQLAVTYGTVFVAAVGNSGPYVGSALETPGVAAQALSVSATAKDYDVNHDDTASGETCAGYMHPPTSNPFNDDCQNGVGNQPPSLSAFPSHGPSGDVWLRPDVAAPGYNIVSAQASEGAGIAGNETSPNTVNDPLYATATGTSMAAPATAGSVALLLQAYEEEHGGKPSGSSGVAGLTAPAYALVRAALMNTAFSGLYEARWILTLPPAGSQTAYQVRNGALDPYVGPLAAGAGKIDVPAAVSALRDGFVVYSAATTGAPSPGTGHRDLQGSWQIGPIAAGAVRTQRFVVHAAPGAGTKTMSFSFEPGNPSDGSSAIPLAPRSVAWSITLPSRVGVITDKIVKVTVKVPAGTPAGFYTGVLVVKVDGGQTLRVPVFAAVELHDTKLVAGNAPGPQAKIASQADVFAKSDTIWPAVPSTPGTGAGADWLVYPVRLAGGLAKAVFEVYDATTPADETYDLYVYGDDFDLLASTHPFDQPGVTNLSANSARPPSTQAAPQTLTLTAPQGGVYYVAVNRAKVGNQGGIGSGDFGRFVLTLDESR